MLPRRDPGMISQREGISTIPPPCTGFPASVAPSPTRCSNNENKIKPKDRDDADGSCYADNESNSGAIVQGRKSDTTKGRVCLQEIAITRVHNIRQAA
jgi:hypothetical protein